MEATSKTATQYINARLNRFFSGNTIKPISVRVYRIFKTPHPYIMSSKNPFQQIMFAQTTGAAIESTAYFYRDNKQVSLDDAILSSPGGEDQNAGSPNDKGADQRLFVKAEGAIIETGAIVHLGTEGVSDMVVKQVGFDGAAKMHIKGGFFGICSPSMVTHIGENELELKKHQMELEFKQRQTELEREFKQRHAQLTPKSQRRQCKRVCLCSSGLFLRS